MCRVTPKNYHIPKSKDPSKVELRGLILGMVQSKGNILCKGQTFSLGLL
jgi:hypothetical protein